MPARSMKMKARVISPNLSRIRALPVWECDCVVVHGIEHKENVKRSRSSLVPVQSKYSCGVAVVVLVSTGERVFKPSYCFIGPFIWGVVTCQP
jgi:hypothetical protein